MKHIETTSWCMDTEEIINAARYVSFAQKEILNNIQHIDSQLRDDSSITSLNGIPTIVLPIYTF